MALAATDSTMEVEERSSDDEAAYELEATVKCPLCSALLSSVHVVRLLRSRVNFTSALPRRGYVAICPSCRGVIPAAIASWLS